jgi:hypothetical protein
MQCSPFSYVGLAVEYMWFGHGLAVARLLAIAYWRFPLGHPTHRPASYSPPAFPERPKQKRATCADAQPAHFGKVYGFR